MRSYLIIIYLIIAFNLSAQDIIIFRSGKGKEAIVKKVGVTTIQYVRYDNQSGPVYEVLKNDVFMIKYANGVTDVFESQQPESTNEKQLNQGMFLDKRDSIYYKYIKIGNLIWMVDNLKYDNGTAPCVVDETDMCNECGRYYTYDEALNICPEGWHLPTDEDWMNLEIKAGMSKKVAEKEGWRGTNPGQAQKLRKGGELGFELLLCGYSHKSNFSKKNPKYTYFQLNQQGYYWTSTEDEFVYKHIIIRHFSNWASIDRKSYYKTNRISVRCVKNIDY